jgi:hypothetical protein
MPSIEIICIKQSAPSVFDDLPFAIESEDELISHRYPSIFQNHFNLLKGCIYHLGGISKEEREAGFYMALELLSEDWRNQEATKFLEFNSEVFPFVQNIISELLKASPVSEVLFTSDYQFCSVKNMKIVDTTLEKFYELHNDKKLMFNTGYKINNTA